MGTLLVKNIHTLVTMNATREEVRHAAVLVGTPSTNNFAQTNFDDATFASVPVPEPVPEPAGLALFGLGLAGMVVASVRKRKASSPAA